MKSIKALLISLFIAVIALIPASVGAYDQIYDSGCTANSQSWLSAVRSGGLSHYFKPTHNHLTKLQVVSHVNVVGKYRIYIKKGDSALYTKEITAPGTGEFYIMVEDFDITVTPGEWYRVQMEVITGNTGWHYKSGTTCDSVGYAFWDGAQQNADMWVYLWGYNVTAPSANPSVDTNNSSSGTNNTNSGSATSQKPTEQQIAEVQGEIDAPVLVEVKEGDNRIDIPEDKKISVKKNSVLKLSGTSVAGSTVRAMYYNKDEVVSTDPDGNWTYELDTSNLSVADHDIEMLAEKDGKQSKKVTVLTANITELLRKAENSMPTNKPNYLLLYLALIILLSILSGFLGYLIYKRKKQGMSKQDKKQLLSSQEKPSEQNQIE